MQQLTDVWTLETPAEEEATARLSAIADAALEGDKWARDYLTRLWDGEPWKSIEAKLKVEGSTWYVWWMGGVRQHLANLTPSLP